MIIKEMKDDREEQDTEYSQMLEQLEKLQDQNEWLQKKVLREREQSQVSQANLDRLIHSKEIDQQFALISGNPMELKPKRKTNAYGINLEPANL